MAKSKRVELRLSEPLAEWLRVTAAERGQSVTELLRLLVVERRETARSEAGL